MTTVSPMRRSLQFDSLAAVLAEAERCVERDAPTTGQWSLGQILEHLALAIDKTIDGFQWKCPWFLRLLGSWLIKPQILRRGMKPGIKLPPAATAELVSPESTDPYRALEHLRRAIGRLERGEPRQPHPFFGRMTDEEAQLLHRRHAELHLSFVVGE
jgi:hypothetical protein